MAFVQGIWWIAIPFIIKRLEGSDAQVGNCCAMQLGGYIAGCFIAWFYMKKLVAKPAVIISTFLELFSVLAIILIITNVPDHISTRIGVRLLIGTAGIFGFVQAFFWPFVMSWLSTGHEGAQLNRKLGWFNSSWSSGRLISPLIGGFLVQGSSLAPLWGMVVFISISFMSACFARSRRDTDCTNPLNQDKTQPADELYNTTNAAFRWMALIVLIATTICVGLIRSQMGLLFKYELDFSESNFGVAMMLLSTATFLVMVVTGKSSYWHHRMGILIIAQIVILISFLSILNTTFLPFFFVITFGFGCSFGFVYASHLYYGVSGSKERSVRMIIHELAVCGGMFIGSLTGGYLSDYFSRYMPYRFGILVISLGLLSQMFMWFTLKPQNKS
jgi:MFS family permease